MDKLAVSSRLPTNTDVNTMRLKILVTVSADSLIPLFLAAGMLVLSTAYYHIDNGPIYMTWGQDNPVCPCLCVYNQLQPITLRKDT